MSGTPIEMSKVKQVIRMYESGVPKKEIARRLGISRNTVKEYIKKTEENNLSPPELLVDIPVTLSTSVRYIMSSSMSIYIRTPFDLII